MGFWSKTIITKTAHRIQKVQHINQQQCPQLQIQQLTKQHQQNFKQHPPTIYPLKQKICTPTCLGENHQKLKYKLEQKSKSSNKIVNTTIKRRAIKKWKQKLQHREKENCTLPNEVKDLLFWTETALDVFKGKALHHNLHKRFNTLGWSSVFIPLLLLSAICSTTCFPNVAAVSAASSTSSAAPQPTSIIATSTVYVTLAATIASVSGAATAYVNGATIYDTKKLKLADIVVKANKNSNTDSDSINNNNNNGEEHIQGEPGEELMYAYYKRAQRHQEHQRYHQHQHDDTVVDIDSTPELNLDEIVPTLDAVSNKKFIVSRTQKRSEKSTSKASKSTTSAPHTTHAPSSDSTAAPTPTNDEKCEPKVLDEVPTEPFYDFSDVAEDAARQFTEFLANKFPNGPPHPKHNISIDLRQEITRRAYGIASNALNEDDNLLAFAIAAPNVHTVVLKFRSNVTIPPEQAQNKSFLGSYWRELIFALNSTEGTQEWGAPFRDCNLLRKRWLWPFRVNYAEYKFKIVTAAFIAADEDVCNDGLEEVFGRRHGCDRNTTFCLLIENKPMPPRDMYTCICKESFYLPNSTLQGFPGDVVEMSEGFDNYSCIPCPGGCTHCDQNGECLLGEPVEVVSMESLMKVTVGTVLGGCILCCFVLSIIVFRQRKSKAIAIGMWTVLETILLGIILLYASVTVHFFPASTERCLIEPWLRELGFIVFYGAIILKLYRHLVEFRTRKAHRWVLRDLDLLKYLGTMVFAVLCYLSGFTASLMDLLNSANLESLREASTNTCLPLKWDYVTQVSEILVLLFGLHLSFASRNANTQFRERQFLVATLVLEFLVSTAFYVLRFIYLQDMSPSTIFLALFLRSQLTCTISLGLIFVPKLWYQHKQLLQVRSLAYDLSIRLPVDAFKGSHDIGPRLGGGYAGLCLGDPDIGELTISEMNPEDIRAELKRLYTQLEILKNKTLRQDNPHISKRRGGRKAGHRRFSLQALSAKHRSNRHHQDIEITEAEPSRTPEDSVCSVEGPTEAEISGVSASMLSHSVISHSVVSQNK